MTSGPESFDSPDVQVLVTAQRLVRSGAGLLFSYNNLGPRPFTHLMTVNNQKIDCNVQS